MQIQQTTHHFVITMAMVAIALFLLFITCVSTLTEDEMEKEIMALKKTVATLVTQQTLQSQAINSLQDTTSRSAAFCQLLPNEICGPCKCFDDFDLQEKYFCDCQHLAPKRDCLAFYQAGVRANGIYKVNNNNLKVMQVYCDQKTDGGGWTVFQRRVDGSINFYRNWREYKQGFGHLQKEFYLGNENIHVLTLQSLYPKGSQLRVDMTDWSYKNVYAKYNYFQVGNENTKYMLHLKGFSGNAGDSLTYANGANFSTYDQDNDMYPGGSCVANHRAGWWYTKCHVSNLNGEYRLIHDKQPGYARGVIWATYKGHTYSFKHVEMKVRRNN